MEICAPRGTIAVVLWIGMTGGAPTSVDRGLSPADPGMTMPLRSARVAADVWTWSERIAQSVRRSHVGFPSHGRMRPRLVTVKVYTPSTGSGSTEGKVIGVTPSIRPVTMISKAMALMWIPGSFGFCWRHRRRRRT